MSYKYVLNLILGIVMLVLVFAAFYLLRQDHQSSTFETDSEFQKDITYGKLREAMEAVNTGDYGQAITIYSSLLSTSNNKFDSQHFILLKAYSLSSTGNQNDTKEALALIDSVIQSPDSTANTRAWAYIAVINFYYLSENPEKMLTDIRALPAFADISDVSNTDDFIQQLLEKSDDLIPTSFGKMYLALSQGRKLFTEQNTLTDDEKFNLARSISENIEASTLLKEQEDRLSQIPYSLNMWLAHMQGFSLGLASAYGGHPTDYVSKLTTAIGLAEDQPDNISMQQMAIFSNFYLAAFGSYTLNTKKQELAKSAVTKIVNESTNENITGLFKSFIRATLSSPQATINKDLLQKLTNEYKDFEEYVNSITNPQL